MIQQGLWDDLDACDVPATDRELDSPDSAAAAEVKRCPVRRLTLSLLTVEQRRDLFGNRKRGHFFPSREADPVGHFVEHAHVTPVSEVHQRYARNTTIVIIERGRPRRSVFTPKRH